MQTTTRRSTAAATPGPTTYVLDPAWHAERDRLASMTRLYDVPTMQIAERLGIRRGWRCLDVGAGTGSVVQLLAERVAPTGRVTAADLDTRFLVPLASDIVDVRQLDVTSADLPTAEYDFVHARLLLEHLPQRVQVVEQLAATLRPGGWLLVEDFDWTTATMVDPASDVHLRVQDGVRTVMEARGYDPWFGRRLPNALRAAGLTAVDAVAGAAVVRGHPDDGIPQWDLLVEQLAPALLARTEVTAGDLEAFHRLCRDPGVTCFAPVMVSAFGRR